MATIQEVLKGVSLYPIPSATLQSIASRRGCALSDEATQETLSGAIYNLAKADLLMWLSLAPSVSQGGQNYSFIDEQRQQFRNEANGLYKEFAADDSAPQKPLYGYKGSRL
jgi:hypothetical protein